ncbi:MAG: gamma-glutamyl-gamma-aminobutyrate hydrolase family protein [Lachnospiraceae bacterium]|nr:gamma-glutamyl-gamma-aminobutyrate hydrolase family protein [Lachnospiraceae bacterium]
MKRILIAGEPDKTLNYENAVRALGACPVTALHLPDAAGYDGLILPGGGDIDPRLFGQLPGGTRAFDPELDRIQIAILKAFVQDKKPVLGICKGMQLINIYFGGDMIQDLPTASAHEYIGADQIHETSAVPGSRIESLYGERFAVNSAHHQGVDLPGCGIVYTQYASDGVAEGLEHRYLPVFGVQWHPERLCFGCGREDAVDGSLLLRNFLKIT